MGREKPTRCPVPRLRFDLPARMTLSAAWPTASGNQSDDRDDESGELPSVYPHTTRATGSSVDERENAPRLVQTARIHFAPPPLPAQLSESSTLNAQRFRPPHITTCSSPRVSIAYTGEDRRAAAKLDTKKKQAAAARAFEALRGLQGQSRDGAAEAMLLQVISVLHDAVYAATSDAGSEGAANVSAARSGSEYFSRLEDTQEELQRLDAQVVDMRTKLAMEEEIRREFEERLRELDDDLELVTQSHASSNERIDVELAAVAQLEREYSALLTHEQEYKREYEVLVAQAEKQDAQLKEVRAKASYLEYVSRGPMKKHLDEKKRRDQADVLLLGARQAEEENAVLEAELAMLDAQLAAIDAQRQHDFDKKAALESTLLDSEQQLERREAAFQRTRECHTPRPHWDDIVEQTPELSHQKFQWEIADDAESDSDELPVLDLDNGDGDGGRHESFKSRETRATGRTKKLVTEMLHWIERLQKHIGVNLHLSRIWHDIEEARVELNILHSQLDRALQKSPKSPTLQASPSARAAKKAKREYIVALGTHEEIPKFLRHQGKVKQREVKKTELEALVRKVWAEKRRRELRTPHASIPLDEVLYEKLRRKYGFQPLVAEWGYNVLVALSAYSWDAELELFLLCLTNAVSDLVYLDQERMLASCQQLLARLSESYGSESFAAERRVLLKDALVTLRKFFPLKTSAQLQAIEKAVIRDMHKMKRGGNDSVLHVDDILPRAGGGCSRGFFVKTVRAQHFKEIQDFYALVLGELEQQDVDGSGRLPLSRIKDAIFQTDPLADAGAVYAALAKGVGVKTRAQLTLHELVDYAAVLKTMNATCLMKFAFNFDPNAELNWQKARAAKPPSADVLNADVLST